MRLALIVLPVFLIFATGFIGQRKLRLDVGSVATMALYLMVPFLVFNTFYTNALDSSYFYYFLFNILVVVALSCTTLLISKIIKADKAHTSAMLLATAFPNMGNYGAPIILFAFGKTAFGYAVITMIIQSLFINTIGMFIAAYGGKKSVTIRSALIRVIKMPVLLSVILGLGLKALHVELSATMLQSIKMVGDASIPAVMLILGMQLAQIKAEKFEWKYVCSIALSKLILSPLLIALLVSFLPISQLLKNVFIVLSAMPIAANTTLLALQFNTKPNLVSYLTLITTVSSLVTIPLLLHLLL
jgi:predicted permease